MWQWPVTFIEVYLPALIEMGRMTKASPTKCVPHLAGAGRPECADDYATGGEFVAEKTE